MAQSSVAKPEKAQPKGLLGAIRSFNGIEIVTIAVFAVLFRVSMFPYRLTSAIFPYNIFIRFFFDALLAALAVTIIRKKGVLASYVVVWWLINYVVEGEDLVWLIGMWPPIILGEWWLSRQKPYGGGRLQTVIGVGILYGVVFGAIYWVYLLTYYQLVYGFLTVLASMAMIAVATVVAAYLGSLFGDRLRPLLE